MQGLGVVTPNVALNVGQRSCPHHKQPRNLGGRERWGEPWDLPFSENKSSRNIFHLQVAGDAFSQAFLAKKSLFWCCHLLKVLGDSAHPLEPLFLQAGNEGVETFPQWSISALKSYHFTNLEESFCLSQNSFMEHKLHRRECAECGRTPPSLVF